MTNFWNKAWKICTVLCQGSRFKCPWHRNEPYVKPRFLRMSCCNNSLSSSPVSAQHRWVSTVLERGPENCWAVTLSHLRRLVQDQLFEGLHKRGKSVCLQENLIHHLSDHTYIFSFKKKEFKRMLLRRQDTMKYNAWTVIR